MSLTAVSEVSHYVGRRAEGTNGSIASTIAVTDDLPGSVIVSRVLGAAGALIADPLSFPWGAPDVDRWRLPVAVDVSQCSEADLVALSHQLRVLTPADVVIGGRWSASDLADHVFLPASSVIAERPGDAELAPLLSGRRDDKLRQAILREVLEPIVMAELSESAGIGEAAQRPLTVLDLDAPDRWRAALVPRPHHYASASMADETELGGAHIVIVDSDVLSADAIRRSQESLAPGGLILLAVGEAAVATAGELSFATVLAWIDDIFDSARVIDEVWGLHTRPGMPTLGAVIGIRPLTPPPQPSSGGAT